jgi:hypothetical protein
MFLEALVPHRAESKSRRTGDRYMVSPDTAKHLLKCKLAKRVDDEPDWHEFTGRELRDEPITDPAWPRVVACVNIWNDHAALAQTMPTWLPHVDHVIVVDGPYVAAGAREPVSTDGLPELLADLPSVELVTRGTAWPGQLDKRNAYLERATPGDLLFIVDADEFVTGAENLKSTPYGDVAWVRMESPLYQRSYGQPRLVRAQPGLRYDGRHHWLYVGDRLLATHQYGGAGFEHRLARVSMFNARGLGHTPQRAAAKRQHLQVQVAQERQTVSVGGAKSDAAIGSRESLRILQVGVYDAGMVGFRLHTALNTTTPHASLFAAPDPGAPKNPYHGPVQFSVERDEPTIKWALERADVIHCNLGYSVPGKLGVALAGRRVVIHHHGTMYRRDAQSGNAWDVANGAGLKLVSNLELLRYGTDLHWLPNPVPVARYQRLRAARRGETFPATFRIAHSPSKRQRKGTEAFLSAVERVRAKGIPVEAVLIEGVRHGEGLALKATCDACFDSFELGIQCSGLEAAAMGMPVIAGDPFVMRQYEELLGDVPYTYANDEDALAEAIEILATRPVMYERAAEHVLDYVTTYHDEAAVALRYLDLLDHAFGWRQAMRTDAPKPETHTPPKPETPKRRKPKRQQPQPVERQPTPEPEQRTA